MKKLILAKICTFILSPLRWAMLLHFKYLAKLVNRYKKKKLPLPWWVKYLVLDFVWLDVKANWVSSAQFMDWPASKGELVTARLQRYIGEHATWDGYYLLPNEGLTPIEWHRTDWALETCKELNEYDEGHCWLT